MCMLGIVMANCTHAFGQTFKVPGGAGAGCPGQSSMPRGRLSETRCEPGTKKSPPSPSWTSSCHRR